MAGGDDLFELSQRLKRVAPELRKELSKAMRDAAKPLIKDTRAAALTRLPRSGGLARRMSRAPQRVQVRTGAKTAGVRIVLKAQQGITSGNLRHPVFGRNVFVNQRVNGEWWDETLEGGAPRVVPEIEAAMERVARQITGG